MSLAQFTSMSRLRDIETTLNLCTPNFYRSGLKTMPKSTLTEANEKKDWRINQDLAQVLMQHTKNIYRGQKLCLDLDGMVYFSYGSNIELCLKLCPLATFHHGKKAIKMYTRMDFRGYIPT